MWVRVIEICRDTACGAREGKKKTPEDVVGFPDYASDVMVTQPKLQPCFTPASTVASD